MSGADGASGADSAGVFCAFMCYTHMVVYKAKHWHNPLISPVPL